MATTQPDRRATANSRLRAGFLDKATRQLRGLAALLAESDGDVVPSVIADLSRLADTADSLGLPGDALRACNEGVAAGLGAAALAPATRALRDTGLMQPQLRPWLVIGDTPQLSRTREDAQRLVESVRFVPDLSGVREALDLASPGALVVPPRLISEARGLAELYACPLLVVGRDDDPARLLQHDGVLAWLHAPLQMSELAALVRTHRAPRPSLILLLGEAPGWRDALQPQHDVCTAPLDQGLLGFDRQLPELVILPHSPQTPSLVRTFRAHPSCGQLPIVVWGAKDPVPYLLSGCSVLPEGTPEPALIDALLQRPLPGVHPTTGGASRARTLFAVDRLIERSRRTQEVVAVGVVLLTGWEEVRAKVGPGPLRHAAQLALTALTGGLRRPDLIGHLDDTAFLVALPRCGATLAHERLSSIQERLTALCQADHSLKGVGWVFGVADTEASPDDVALRADRAACQARLSVL